MAPRYDSSLFTLRCHYLNLLFSELMLSTFKSIVKSRRHQSLLFQLLLQCRLVLASDIFISDLSIFILFAVAVVLLIIFIQAFRKVRLQSCHLKVI